MSFEKGDRVVAAMDLMDGPFSVPKGTSGTVTNVLRYHSTGTLYLSFPYDVEFDGYGFVSFLDEKEIKAYVPSVPWYHRAWNRVKAATKPRDAESEFGTEETVNRFQEVQRAGKEYESTWPWLR